MSPEEAEIRDGVTRMVCPNREALIVLLNEIDRLRKAMTEPGELKKFSYTPEDGIEFEIEHWAVKLIAASLWDTFDKEGGENFVTTTIDGHKRGPIEVTIRPCWGGKKTTSQVLGELRDTINSMAERVAAQSALLSQRAEREPVAGSC